MAAERGPDGGVVERRIADLLAEARYQRHRYDLYRAKMYGPRPTTMARLRELERAYHGAEGRLRRAQRAVPRNSTARSSSQPTSQR
jgi:hypothetical protein